MRTLRLLQLRLGVALLAGGLSLAALGPTLSTARAEPGPCPAANGRCGTPYEWCPTNQVSGQPNPLPEGGITWDMTTCHWYWYTPTETGNVGPHTTETGAP